MIPGGLPGDAFATAATLRAAPGLGNLKLQSDKSEGVLFSRPLWGVAGFRSSGSARVNILGTYDMPWRGTPFQVGETIGMPAQRRLGARACRCRQARPGTSMHPFSIFLIGIAMSTDAFAAAIGKGAAMRNPRFPEALRAGLIFGVIEGLTPAIGWLLGNAASRYIEAWDHWIAFALLAALGLHMIHAGLKHDDAEDPGKRPQRHGFWALAITGFATSIDAMAVGVGLAFADTPIGIIAVVIGLCTLVMVTTGIMLGRVLGALAGKRAEIGGGVILIVIGATIVYEHLNGVAIG